MRVNKTEKKKDIKTICSELNSTIDGGKIPTDFRFKLIYDLKRALANNISLEDINQLSETVIKIAKTKNRQLRYIEPSLLDLLGSMVSRIMPLDEEPELDEEFIKKRDALTNLAFELLGLPNSKSKGDYLRRSWALTLLGDILLFSNVDDIKKILFEYLQSSSYDEQYAALEGLINYYDNVDEELEDEMIDVLDAVFETTNHREIASGCLQVQINAGIIDEGDALDFMGDWKEEHYR